MSSNQTVRKHMRITGRVQGVGFRYRAQYYARSLDLTGWVRNHYSGAVILEVQGIPEAITKMLVALNSDSYIRIEGIETEERPVQKEERGFHILY